MFLPFWYPLRPNFRKIFLACPTRGKVRWSVLWGMPIFVDILLAYCYIYEGRTVTRDEGSTKSEIWSIGRGERASPRPCSGGLLIKKVWVCRFMRFSGAVMIAES
jgi:pSer/pThr/pTyr-binding forkhead associated (FHA) protein